MGLIIKEKDPRSEESRQHHTLLGKAWFPVCVSVPCAHISVSDLVQESVHACACAHGVRG